MKKLTVLLAFLVLVELGSKFILPMGAQSAPPSWFSVGPALHTVCQITPGVTTFCYADDGFWESDHGGAWFRVGGGVQAGVSSFNGRTGAVTAQAGDYSYSQIAGAPPPSGVASFNGRTGAVVAIPNDYSYPMLSGAPPQKPSFNCATFSFIATANPPFAVGGCQ